MSTLDNFALGKLAVLDRRLTRRTLAETTRLDGIHVTRDGQRMISFCCNDYLNLTHHPALRHAATTAIERYGTGAAASRLVTGNHPLYQQLEGRLARHRLTDAAAVFGSGYLANSGTVASLVGEEDLVLLDSLAHACLHAGAKLSGATVLIFRHNDPQHLSELLRQHRARFTHCLIGTEGVFSMDGDMAPVAELSAIAQAHEAWLLVDDAHTLDAAATRTSDGVPLQMGTLSKTLGSYGGYVCASAPVIALLHSRARPFIYSTGLPPASVAAAIAALDLIEADPSWAVSPIVAAQRFAALMQLPKPASQIVPIILGESSKALAVSAALAEAGFLVTAIRPPTVPDGTARIRLTFTADHTDADISALAAALMPLLQTI
jgi:8-amino-7-oxononanoate synthase